jgi:LmbE family N-acetylglucosaminyl deacetylase
MDSRLDLYPRKDLVRLIEEVIADVRPNVLMFSGPSFHHDHTAVYEAVIAATRPTARYFPDEMYILENPT